MSNSQFCLPSLLQVKTVHDFKNYRELHSSYGIHEECDVRTVHTECVHYVPLVSITTRSLSSARHSTDTAASDTPLGDRVWEREGGSKWWERVGLKR
jgi:hypothetical protein